MSKKQDASLKTLIVRQASLPAFFEVYCADILTLPGIQCDFFRFKFKAFAYLYQTCFKTDEWYLANCAL